MEEEKKELLEGTQTTEAAAGVSKPGEYSSQWQGQLSDAIGKILDRKDFSYDVNGDALYQQYKDRYVQGGKMAMMDTLGQASALTGGYGNSYAQAAGQQAYQGYLQGLNDKIPELYQLALDKYDREGDAMYKRYSLLGAQEGQDYDRYQNSLNQYQQSWENAFRLYQAGVKTPEVLEILGIPENSGGGFDQSYYNLGLHVPREASSGKTQKEIFEETYRQLKQSGSSQQDLDKLLNSAMSDGTLTSREATDIRDKRW